MLAKSVATMILQRMQKNGELGDEPPEKVLKIIAERTKRQQAAKQAAADRQRPKSSQAATTSSTSSTYQPAATSTTDAAQAHTFSSAAPKATAHDEL